MKMRRIIIDTDETMRPENSLHPWLQMTPNYLLGICFPSAQWQLLLRWCIATLLARGVDQCPGCRGCLDHLGDHALSCAVLGSYHRHIFLRDCLCEIAQNIGISARKVPIAVDANNVIIPADVLIDNFESSFP